MILRDYSGDLCFVLQEISVLHNLVPEFESKAHYLISRFVKEEQLAEHIIEGLNKAGMKIRVKNSNRVKSG